MDHTGTISKTDLARPFHAQCSCGSAGDFTTESEALAYLQNHFAKQTGISTYEMQAPPAVKPSLPPNVTDKK